MGTNNLLIRHLLVSFVIFFSCGSYAQDVFFPEDEIPSESVIPLLDSPKATLNRTVEFTKKWESKLTYGFLLDEPFYQNSFLSLLIGYSWSESSGLSLGFMKWGQGLSDYSKQFEGTANNLKFDRARGPDLGYYLSYDYRFFYGKVSFSRTTVIPTIMSANLDGGMIRYGSRQLPFFGGGISNSWYFTTVRNKPHWGLNLSVKIYARNAMDPLSKDLKGASAAPSESEFGTVTRISTLLNLGAQYLF